MIPITHHRQDQNGKSNPSSERNRSIRIEFDDGLEGRHGYFVFQGATKTHEIIFHPATALPAAADGVTPEALLAIVQDYLERHKTQPHYKEAAADVKHALTALKKH